MSDKENTTSEEPSAYDGIRPKDRRCVDEFLVNGMVQWTAYRDKIAKKESYDKYESLRTQSSTYFAKHNIQRAITERLEAEAMSRAEVLHRLGEQARNLQAQYFGKDGVDLPKLLDAGLGHLIKGFRRDKTGQLLVEFYDVQSALKTILQAHDRPAKGTKEEPIHVKATGIDFAHGTPGNTVG